MTTTTDTLPQCTHCRVAINGIRAAALCVIVALVCMTYGCHRQTNLDVAFNEIGYERVSTGFGWKYMKQEDKP